MIVFNSSTSTVVLNHFHSLSWTAPVFSLGYSLCSVGKNLEGRSKDTLLQVVVVVMVVVVVQICESLNIFQSLSSTAQQRHASLCGRCSIGWKILAQENMVVCPWPTFERGSFEGNRWWLNRFPRVKDRICWWWNYYHILKLYVDSWRILKL